MDENMEAMEVDVSSTTSDSVLEVTKPAKQDPSLDAVVSGVEVQDSDTLLKCTNDVLEQDSVVTSNENSTASINNSPKQEKTHENQLNGSNVIEKELRLPEKFKLHTVSSQALSDEVSKITDASVSFTTENDENTEMLETSVERNNLKDVNGSEVTMPNQIEAMCNVQSNSPNNDVEQLSVDNMSTSNTSKVLNATGVSQDSFVNDSLAETNSDSLDSQEHNKSISRELKSLIKSAKESKIISECTQITSKIRKSRNLDSYNHTDAAKLNNRRGSSQSLKSNSSDLSEKNSLKRSMRSQNPDFVNKVKQFLSSVTGKSPKLDLDENSICAGETDESDVIKVFSSTPKHKQSVEMSPKKKLRSDLYCWRCHWQVEQESNDKVPAPQFCSICPRSYHHKCLTVAERNKIDPNKKLVCPECMMILNAESSETRSPAMKKMSLGTLCELLNYALETMMEMNGVEPFLQPIDTEAFPHYDEYVVHPMDLNRMKKNIQDRKYGSTEAFLSDTQWILHNSIIFNTLQSKVTGVARALLRQCRTEMAEIEACHECYAAAHARRVTWFTDVCSTPHVLLWAKLKGFPYWPAKGMTINSAGMVDVRFFGAHDRAWVPAKDCFLYSERDPNNFKAKRQDILDSMKEAEYHISNISRKYGKFVYPPFKTQFDPSKLNEQIKIMIPTYNGEIRLPDKLRSSIRSPASDKREKKTSSKSSKDSNDSDNVESERPSPKVNKRKYSTSSEIKEKRINLNNSKEPQDWDMIEATRIDKPKISSSNSLADDLIVLNDSSSNKVTSDYKKSEGCKKRRHSDLEEAVITILERRVTPKRVCENDRKKSNEELNSKTCNKTKIGNKSNDKTNQKSAIEGDKSEIKHKNKSTEPNELRSTCESTTQKESKSSKLTVCEKQKSFARKNKSFDKSRELDKDMPVAQSKPKSNSNASPIKKNLESAVEASKTPKGISKATANSKESQNKSSSNCVTDQEVILVNNIPGLPTITSVRSLSNGNPNQSSTITSSSNGILHTIEVPVEIAPNVITPISTKHVQSMKDAVNKLQRLRYDADKSLVGKVGVRSFARMASPSKDNQIEVEIKAEPIELDDPERQMEKVNHLKSFQLQPVTVRSESNSQSKVKLTNVVRKVNIKKMEAQPRAKKTFPQPKKPDVGRSELNSKNSMVYIPIQPPLGQPPAKSNKQIVAVNGPVATNSTLTLSNTSAANNVGSMGPALITNCSPVTNVSNGGTKFATTLAQIPASVHTVPLITSVNGQWTFSLQPVMSVGGVNSTSPPPLVNGVVDSGVCPVVGPLPPLAAPAALSSTGTSTAATEERPASSTLRAHSPLGDVPVPPSAGPLSAKLQQSAAKLTDLFRSILEETLDKSEEPSVRATALGLQLEQARWRHQQEISELKHNHELTLAEVRASLEQEKAMAVAEARRACKLDLDAAVRLAKTKQWCANCAQEAQFYCCWNTAYCDYSCQRVHWATHYAHCTQARTQENGETQSRLQAAPQNQKNTTAPKLTVGGKMIVSRIQNDSTKKSVLVVEESPGALKCNSAGSLPKLTKSSATDTQASSASECNKVVSSGGYIVLGAGAELHAAHDIS